MVSRSSCPTLSTAATSSAGEAPRCASVFCTRGPNSRGACSNSATSTRAVLSLIGYLRFMANRTNTSSRASGESCFTFKPQCEPALLSNSLGSPNGRALRAAQHVRIGKSCGAPAFAPVILLLGPALIVNPSRRMRWLCQSQSQMHVICSNEPGAPIDRQSRRVI